MLDREMLHPPWAMFETWSHFWCGMEQAGAQGLAGNEHGRDKAGSLSCVSSSCVSLPSLHHGLALGRGPACCSSFCVLERHSQHPELPMAAWDEEACQLLGKRRVSGRALGAVGDGAKLCCWAGLQRGERAAARGWVAAAGTLQGLCTLELNYFLLLESKSLPVGRLNLDIFDPCKNPSLVFPGIANRPLCLALPATPVQNYVFPFLFMLAELIQSQECVLALGVWDMYLLFHSSVNCRVPNFWLHLLMCVTVYYCNPKHDNTGMWLLQLKRVFEENCFWRELFLKRV